MVDFALAGDQAKQNWSNAITREYVRSSGFLPYMGKGSIFNLQNELGSNAGAIVHVPALGKLRGAVVRGCNPLVGNEDAQASYSMRVETDIVRTAIAIKLCTSFRTEMDLYNEGKTAIKTRLAEALRDDLIVALQSIPIPGTSTGTNPEDFAVSYAASTATQKNNWLTANNDRVLFGNKKSYTTAGNVATSLATLNTNLATSKMSAQSLSLARKMARQTTNSGTFAIEPYRTSTGEEWYVLFVDSNGYRDLKFDPVIYSANLNARPRETDIKENPIFSGTNNFTYDGVIVVEIPELPVVATNIGLASLCGVQAVNVAWTMKARPDRRKEDDYGMVAGIAGTEIRGQQKATVNLVQVGMLSWFHPSQDDA